MGDRAAITLRPMRPEDEPFLYRVYASTREEELAPLPWDDAQKEAFLRMQFHAQHVHYQTYYGDGDFLIILRDEVPIGRLYVHRSDSEICVVDIALLPEARGVGIGGALMRDLLEEADAAGKPVRLHVESFNRASRLYARLGFVRVQEEGVYFLMERLPKPRSTSGSGSDSGEAVAPEEQNSSL
jgi:ribosomal protein S18 acetylase RimI-like enzyme